MGVVVPAADRGGTAIDLHANLLKVWDVALAGQGQMAFRADNASVEARLLGRNASRAAFEAYGTSPFNSDARTCRSASEMLDGRTPLKSSAYFDAAATVSHLARSSLPTISVLSRLKGAGMAFVSTWGRSVVGAFALIGVESCAGDRYAGVDLRANAAPTEVQALAHSAQEGDKLAQFALGKRYEAGLGVERDLSRAIALYRRAAEDSGGDRWIYMPSTSPNVRGQLIRVSTPRREGLRMAKARLRTLMSTRP